MEKMRGETDVDAGEGERLRLARAEVASSSGFAVTAGAAAAELALLVEEQVARGLAVLHGQRGERIVFRVKPHHAREIDGAENIDVVHEEWGVNWLRAGSAPASRKNHAAFFKPPPVSSKTSSRETSILMPKLRLACEVVDNLLGEMMDVDDDFAHAEARAGARG